LTSTCRMQIGAKEQLLLPTRPHGKGQQGCLAHTDVPFKLRQTSLFSYKTIVSPDTLS